jgi:23S rRNA (guanine745-N1)-methyltransferase
VLKPDGYLLVASPGPEQLRELKARLYSDVREHTLPEVPEGFVTVTETRETFAMSIDTNVDIRALLAMTPLAWRGNRAARAELEQATRLDVTADFLICCYRKAAGQPLSG